MSLVSCADNPIPCEGFNIVPLKEFIVTHDGIVYAHATHDVTCFITVNGELKVLGDSISHAVFTNDTVFVDKLVTSYYHEFSFRFECLNE